MSQIAHPELEGIGNYEFGWSDKMMPAPIANVV
ncbi:hypothetical protein EMGBS5_00400 [Clavibacter sp.]|nr:hypothetical protein EMGBS5_00400 [Clavibacter sp.]